MIRRVSIGFQYSPTVLLRQKTIALAKPRVSLRTVFTRLPAFDLQRDGIRPEGELAAERVCRPVSLKGRTGILGGREVRAVGRGLTVKGVH